MSAIKIVAEGMSWFWCYIMGYILGFTLVISIAWLFLAGIWTILTG